MKKKLLAAVLVLIILAVLPVYAEEQDSELFLSLTRKPEPGKNLPTNLATVTKKDIENKSARTLDEVLNYTSDINLGKVGTLGAKSSIILRGALDNQVLVLVDGRPVNDITLGGYNFSELNVQNIDRVEIIRGAASSIYGANALAGVINVITKEKSIEKVTGDINISFGELGEKICGLTIAKKTGNFETSVSGTKILSDGYRENSAYDNNDINVYLGFNSGTSGMFKLKTGINSYELGVPGRNNTSVEQWDNNIEKLAYDSNAKQTSNKTDISLSHEINVSGDIKLYSSIYNNSNTGRYTSPISFNDDSTDKTTTGLNIKSMFPFGLTAGIELREDKAKRINELSGMVSYNEKVQWASLYLQGEYLLLNNLNSIIGVRYDNHSYFGGQINPQLTVVWNPEQNWKFSSNIGKSYRAPSFEDLFSPYSSWPQWGIFPGGDTQGNTDIKPETSLSYDVGVERKITGNIITQVTLFQQDVDGLIEWSVVNDDPVFEQWRPSNVSEAHNKGCELQFNHTVNNIFSYNVNYTYLESKGKKNTEQGYKTLMYRPVNVFNCGLSCSLPLKTKVTLTGKYIGEQYDESDNIISPYNLLNIRIEKSFFDYTKIFIAVDNAGNIRYFERAGNPLPGRIIRGGMSIFF